MRLKENFFDTDEMVLLESMPDGILYSNILIKLYLKSLKYEGRLLFKDHIPYNSEMIATVTRHPVGVVEKALQVYKQLGLIDVLPDNVLYMSDIELMIGKTSTEADRKRLARMKINSGEMLGIPEKKTENGQMSDKRPPEYRVKSLELEIKDIESKDAEGINSDEDTKKGSQQKKSDQPNKVNHSNSIDTIISYLNDKTGKRYSSKSAGNKRIIQTRLNEGYTVDDFKRVIDHKCKEWLPPFKFSNGKMSDTYLRPSTLFNQKFDQYLNEAPEVTKEEKENNIKFGGYDFEL